MYLTLRSHLLYNLRGLRPYPTIPQRLVFCVRWPEPLTKLRVLRKSFIYDTDIHTNTLDGDTFNAIRKQT